MTGYQKRRTQLRSGSGLRLLLLAVSLIFTCCTTLAEQNKTAANIAQKRTGNSKEDSNMLSAIDFSKLQFLVGRWEGKGPDSKLFYEEYRFEGAGLFRSIRYKDATFSEPIDGSTVEFADGNIIVKWLEYSWQASEIIAGKACFTPLNAPSSFCWEQVDSGTVHVTQSWSGDDGKPQQFVIPLRRL